MVADVGDGAAGDVGVFAVLNEPLCEASRAVLVRRGATGPADTGFSILEPGIGPASGFLRTNSLTHDDVLGSDTDWRPHGDHGWGV